MKLENKYKGSKYEALNEFYCDITRFLDEQIGSEPDSVWKHYIYRHYIYHSEELCKKKKCLAIRVPGRTIGGIWLDNNYVIEKIEVDTDYVVKNYPENINELLQKFIGEKIEIGD